MNSYNPCLLLHRELMVIAVSSRFKISEFRTSREGKLTTVALSYYTAFNVTFPDSLWISRHCFYEGH